MSSGAVHGRATNASATVVLFSSIFLTLATEQLLYLSGGLFVWFGVKLGLILTPDMDVDNGNITHWKMGKVGLRWWWSWLWAAYAVGIEHRSFISHFPIIGTLYRFVYIGIPCTIIFAANQKTSKLKLWLLIVRSQIAAIPILILYSTIIFYVWYSGDYYSCLYVFAGLSVSDGLHFMMDNKK